MDILIQVVVIAFGVLFTALGFLIARTLTHVDNNLVTLSKNQAELYTKIHNLGKEFAELKGEHKVNHRSNG